VAITFTRYASVASSKVIKACFVHWWGCLSGNWFAKIPDLTTSWCLMSQTVRINTIVDHGGFLLRVEMNWSRSSLRTSGECYMVNWRPFTSILIYSHPIACCFLFLLQQVLWTILKCASWVIYFVAALAASCWTRWCRHSCCVPRIPVFDVPPTSPLEFNLLSRGGDGCASLMCWCGIGAQDDKEKKWDILRTI